MPVDHDKAPEDTTPSKRQRCGAEVNGDDHTLPWICENASPPEALVEVGVADDFPWRRISALQVQADFAKLRERVVRDAVCWPIRVCFAGYECSDWAFQKHRLAVSSNGRPSCVDLWRTERVRVETYFAEKGKTDLQASLKFLGKAPAHFSPYVAAMMYKHLGSKRVYDPYAGWGDRCVAAMAMGVDYFGVDSNPTLQSPYQQLIETLPHTGNIRFVSGRSEEVTLGDYQPDLVFTSPPFWTKSRRLLESYPMCESDMNKFIQLSLLPMMRAMLPSAGVVLYINESLFKAVERVFGPPQVFKFVHKVSQNDPYGDCLFYWPPMTEGLSAARLLETPAVLGMPRRAATSAIKKTIATATSTKPSPIATCRTCKCVDPARFEPGKKGLCRDCANEVKRCARAQRKELLAGQAARTLIGSADQARDVVFAWRQSHGCLMRTRAGETCYDLYTVIKRLRQCDGMCVSLPGPRKVIGSELHLEFNSPPVLHDTIEMFKRVNLAYHGQ